VLFLFVPRGTYLVASFKTIVADHEPDILKDGFSTPRRMIGRSSPPECEVFASTSGPAVIARRLGRSLALLQLDV
jgi:hypothetical protein